MIEERRVLGGIEDLEHRARGIAAPVVTHLVDLVEHEDGVLRGHLLQALEDAPRHRADVRAAMTFDLGLVAHAAHAEAEELPAEGARDALTERGLADAGRSGKAQHRAPGVGFELANGEELDDAVLDLLKTVMVLVEDLAGPLDIARVGAGLRPRQSGDDLEVRADDIVLGGLGGNAREPLHLVVGARLRFSGQAGGVELLAELVDGRDPDVFLFAELGADGLELFAQQELTLRLLDLLADLLRDAVADVEQVELAHRHLERLVQTLGEIELGQELQALADVARQMLGHEVGQRARVIDGKDRLLELVGGLGVRLEESLELDLQLSRERLELLVGDHDLHGIRQAHDRERLGAQDALGLSALHQVHERRGAVVRQLEDAKHPGDDADRSKIADA